MEEPLRILCVDDEKNILKAIKRVFIDENYEILIANSIEEGLDILSKIQPIQIVISDYRMPGRNGVDFLKEVRQKWPETIRIILSGYADTASIVSAINEGQIYKFIPKPWNDDELKIAISNAFERYLLRRKNRLLTEELKKRNAELINLNKNLERLVTERTSELIFQNKILIRSQNILDYLPIGVIGIDTDGIIAQCNRRAMALFNEKDSNVIGKDRKDVLPDNLNSFIDKVVDNTRHSSIISINTHTLKVKGVFMKNSEGQEGIILTLDQEE